MKTIKTFSSKIIWKFRIVVLLIPIFLSCKFSNKELNCDDFKFGIFHYNAKETGDSYFIIRTDSIQTERNSTTGFITKAQIKWISDCEYQLNYIDEVASKKDSIAGYLKTHKLTTRILKTKNGEINGTRYNYCVFESSMFGVNQKLVDTLWKHVSED